MYIALQLYSIRPDWIRDFDIGLRMAAKAGYNSVEFAGYGGLPASELKRRCEEYNLKPLSSHVSLDMLRSDLEGCVQYLKDAGAEMAFCPGAYVYTLDEIRETAVVLEKAAVIMREAGLRFGYHNHKHEFSKVDGKYILDWLLELAPAMGFQPDTVWISRGGEDPITYAERWKDRVLSIHARDAAADGVTDVYTGEGTVDFKRLAGIFDPERYPFIVEQETFYGDRQEGIERCYRGLMRGIGK
jgi:sugar phosphate isomerase/epimerase